MEEVGRVGARWWRWAAEVGEAAGEVEEGVLMVGVGDLGGILGLVGGVVGVWPYDKVATLGEGGQVGQEVMNGKAVEGAVHSSCSHGKTSTLEFGEVPLV